MTFLINCLSGDLTLHNFNIECYLFVLSTDTKSTSFAVAFGLLNIETR